MKEREPTMIQALIACAIFLTVPLLVVSTCLTECKE